MLGTAEGIVAGHHHPIRNSDGRQFGVVIRDDLPAAGENGTGKRDSSELGQVRRGDFGFKKRDKPDLAKTLLNQNPVDEVRLVRVEVDDFINKRHVDQLDL